VVGGLLVCLLSREAAEAYCCDLEALDGHLAWIVGHVVTGSNTARIVDNFTVIDV
jgi:hypothetical protein